MLATLLRLRNALMNPEMPIHVRHPLLSSLFVPLEPPTALGTSRAQVVVQRRQQMRPEPLIQSQHESRTSNDKKRSGPNPVNSEANQFKPILE